MKKVIFCCLLFFAFASSQAIGCGNNRDILFTDAETTIASDTLIYIKPGTATNFKIQNLGLQDSVAISKHEEALVYISDGATVFFGENTITNAIPFYIKAAKKRAIIAVKKRKKLSAPSVPVLEINQTFLIASEVVQLPEPIIAIAVVSSPKPQNSAKIYRDFPAIPSDFYFNFYIEYKLKLPAYQEHQNFKSVADAMDYALFSRPPTA